jgi:hypothetical protein
VQYVWGKYWKIYTVLSSLGVVFLMCIFVNCICLVCIVILCFVIIYLCICYTMYLCICYTCCFTLDAGLLARSHYPEGPATGHLDTGLSWFPSVYKRTLRRFPSFQVATTCFSCSHPHLNFLVTYLIFYV